MPRRLSKGGLDPTKVPDHLQHDHSTSTLASGTQNPGAHPEVGYQATTQGCRSGIWIWSVRWWSRRRGNREWDVHWWWRSWGIKLPPLTLNKHFGICLIDYFMLSGDCTSCFLSHIPAEVPCQLQAVVLQRLAIPWVHISVEDGYSNHWTLASEEFS